MRTFLSTKALSFDDRRFDIIDLILAGVLSGQWPQLETESAAGVVALAAARPSSAALQEAATAFRYDHSLLAREDLERWLRERDLSTEDWYAYLRRRLARELSTTKARTDPSGVLRVDALCSGVLAACAREVVAGAAAERAVGRAEPDKAAVDELVRLARTTIACSLENVDDDGLTRAAQTAVGLATARTTLERESTTADAVMSRLELNALAWLSFDTDELVTEREDAGREARLCVREDGARLVDVAAEIGTATTRRTRVFVDTPVQLAARLAAAAPGELVGPVAAEDGFVLALVRAKRRPSPEDAAIAQRARAELVAEAIAKHSAGRTTWHAAL